MTGHFTSYKLRTLQELATTPSASGCGIIEDMLGFLRHQEKNARRLRQQT